MLSRTSLTTAATLTATALLAAHASAAAVNFGNLVVYNNPLTTIPFNAPIGGTYVKFVYTTNWSYNSGSPTSSNAAWFVGNPINSIVASFTSISGMASNANPTTITIAGTFSVGVTNANSLQFVAAQNSNHIGQFATSANWGNATLNFYTQKPLPPTPTGIQLMGPIIPSAERLITIDTGGSDFNPAVALFGIDGLLLASNDDPGTGLPSTALHDITLRPGDYYVFIAGEGATFGPEDLEVSVPPGAPGGTLGGGIGGVPWPDPYVAEGEGQWFGFTVATPVCAGDINGDGSTNAADFTILAGNFGSTVFPFTSGDLSGDGLVNAADFTILAGNFGCSPW